jgi:chromosome segregation ATPase
MMLDKRFLKIRMQIEKIINLNNQLNEDIGKLQIENDVLLAKNNLLQEENEKLKADLRGKDNEINDLKERIAYLEQFKPKEKTIPIKQK